MASEGDQQQKVWVDLETEYPEVVLCVGKIRFGEKARKNMPKKSKQDQKRALAQAVCALLNSGGGVIKAEIENETYNLERSNIGPDIEETFQSLILFLDWTEYLDFKQRDNYLLIFVKTWSSKNTASERTEPRICSLSTGCYIKVISSLYHVSPEKAIQLLKRKQDTARTEISSEPPVKIRKIQAVGGDMNIINNTVDELFNRDQLRHGETLTFTESGHVEFKHYSTDRFLTRVKEILPRYITGFANAAGGYLWIGVDDDGKVQGFSSDDEGLEGLSLLISSIRNKLTLFHFCGEEKKHDISYKHKIFKVYREAGDHCGYVCAVKIEPFTCVAFAEDPDSWLVEGNTIRKLKANEWAEWMTAADPDVSKFSGILRQELSVTEGPPFAKPVYSHQGLGRVDDLCKQLFPVESQSIICTPEKLTEDLLQEHQGLDILMKNQLKQLSEGVLIFSRSWAVDIGLPKKKDIICDVLLIAKGRPPILYTICKRPISKDFFEYSRRIAWKLKEKLVNTGGYSHKLCVIPKLLTLPPAINGGEEWDLNIEEMYPQNYSLITSGNMKDLLRALTVALLSFKSFLTEHVGSEFLNLLTMEQYQVLSENLHKSKKLFVYGLPGTGKTIVALKIIEKIRTMLQCTKNEVLYVCENQPLRDFVWQKNICQAVTRVTFLNANFDEVKHIIVDEAQNFQADEGDWYSKALAITSSPYLPEPGFFWIFLDYLQKSHCSETGLPPEGWHDPVESLTKVVRNANSIYSDLKYHMKDTVDDPTLDIPEKLWKGLLRRTKCARAVKGHSTETYLSKGKIAEYVAGHCSRYLKKGYSKKDIAILCHSDEAVNIYHGILASELRKLNIYLGQMKGGVAQHAVIDSVRRFSGLERCIVFAIIPSCFVFHTEILNNILVCVVSRANLNLHVIFSTNSGTDKHICPLANCSMP